MILIAEMLKDIGPRSNAESMASLNLQPKTGSFMFYIIHCYIIHEFLTSGRLQMTPKHGDKYQFSELVEIMRRLRAPEGCPWDIEQDHQSLMPYLIEETSELIEALQNKDDPHIEEELGDVLLQVVFHAQIAEERSAFEMSGVIDKIAKKLISRHPHVFGDAELSTREEVEIQWEELKKKEEGKTHRQSVLDDVSIALPGLQYAAKIQKRASSVGFDWSDAASVKEKILEELGEVQEAFDKSDQEHVQEEIGDLLFSVVNYARHLEVDPEIAMRQAALKFKKRFQFMENHGEPLKRASKAELEILWTQAKKALGRADER